MGGAGVGTLVVACNVGFKVGVAALSVAVVGDDVSAAAAGVGALVTSRKVGCTVGVGGLLVAVVGDGAGAVAVEVGVNVTSSTTTVDICDLFLGTAPTPCA